MKQEITPEQRQAEVEHMLRSNSSSISAEYPNIKCIEIKIQFTDNDDGNKFENNKTYKPESKAYFQYECPHRECINGGYDFKNTIEKALQSRDHQAQETLICHGWQDKERINKYKCLLKALVTVKINLEQI